MLLGAATVNRAGVLDSSMSDDGERASGPLDVDILDRIGQRLAGSDRFSAVSVQPETAPDSVVADLDRGYYPTAVERSYLQIRWFETDDFSVHYCEQYSDGTTWECRWDRHPNDHNTRDHFHPPPDTPTPGTDTSHPTDWREMLTRVLTRLDVRIRAFWE